MIELNSYMGITCPLFSCQITVITKSDGGGSDLIPLCFVSSVIAEETNGKALQEPAGPCDHRLHRHFAGHRHRPSVTTTTRPAGPAATSASLRVGRKPTRATTRCSRKGHGPGGPHWHDDVTVIPFRVPAPPSSCLCSEPAPPGLPKPLFIAGGGRACVPQPP